MFQLTKKEKQIVAFVLLAFLAGWSFQQLRTHAEFEEAAALLDPHELTE